MDDLLKAANNLPPVSLSASTAHHDHLQEMTTFVDETLSGDPHIHALIGNNPLQIMYDNHRHHGAFMSTVFSLGSYSMLAGMLPWVYRTYHAHNFSYAYFPLELKTWILAGEQYLPKGEMSAIGKIYEWMIAQHDHVTQLSQKDAALEIPVDTQWLQLKNKFQTALLRSDHKTCLDLATAAVKSSQDIEGFYMQVLQPVLYEVGRLWERADISVAQEHLASAIVSRVMASVNLLATQSADICGKAVIAATPNEYHEIGATMISDVLEHDGWQISYLGANLPHLDLLQHLREFKPEILALSVTIPFNVDKARNIIAAIRKDDALRQIKVMVGGRAFNDTEGLWQAIGADGFAVNLNGVKRLAQTWRQG